MNDPEKYARKPPQGVRSFPAQLALMLLMLLAIVALFVSTDWRGLVGALVVYSVVVYLVSRVNWRR